MIHHHPQSQSHHLCHRHRECHREEVACRCHLCRLHRERCLLQGDEAGAEVRPEAEAHRQKADGCQSQEHREQFLADEAGPEEDASQMDRADGERQVEDWDRPGSRPEERCQSLLAVPNDPELPRPEAACWVAEREEVRKAQEE